MESEFNNKTPEEIAKMLVDEFLKLQFHAGILKNKRLAIKSARLVVGKIDSAIDFDWMEVQNLNSEHRRWDSVDAELIKLLNEN